MDSAGIEFVKKKNNILKSGTCSITIKPANRLHYVQKLFIMTDNVGTRPTMSFLVVYFFSSPPPLFFVNRIGNNRVFYFSEK